MDVYHPSRHMRAAEALLPAISNPHHRAILENYRYHALLEVAGRWEEILTPALTVEHPVYRISAAGRLHVYDGRDAVAGFYRNMKEGRRNVLGPVEQYIAVADWGFSAEARFQSYALGEDLRANGLKAEPGKTYRLEWWAASAWRYTPDAKLIGEHVFESMAPLKAAECSPADYVSPEQAAEILAPILAKGLDGWRA